MRIIECQGSVVEATDLTVRGVAPKCAGKRGTVVGFSKSSRRRMINFISRFDLNKVRTVFLTLTFSSIPTPKEAKRALKQFKMRLMRAFPAMSAVWRAEMQQRGAVHFHLIVFNMPYVPQHALQHSWQECTREARSIVHVTLMKNPKMVMRYVSKYVAKLPDAATTSLEKASYQHNPTPPQFEGRAWGWINFKALPLADLTFAVLHCDEEASYLWWAAWARARRRWPVWWGRATMFVDDATAYALGSHARDASNIFLRVEGRAASLDLRKSVYKTLREGLQQIM